MDQETKRREQHYGQGVKVSATIGAIAASVGIGIVLVADKEFRQWPLENIIAFSAILIPTASAIITGADYVVGKSFNLIGDYIDRYITKRI